MYVRLRHNGTSSKELYALDAMGTWSSHVVSVGKRGMGMHQCGGSTR